MVTSRAVQGPGSSSPTAGANSQGPQGTPANIDYDHDFMEALQDQIAVVVRQLGAFGPISLRALREAVQGRMRIDLSGCKALIRSFAEAAVSGDDFCDDHLANANCWHDGPFGKTCQASSACSVDRRGLADNFDNVKVWEPLPVGKCDRGRILFHSLCDLSGGSDTNWSSRGCEQIGNVSWELFCLERGIHPGGHAPSDRTPSGRQDASDGI